MTRASTRASLAVALTCVAFLVTPASSSAQAPGEMPARTPSAGLQEVIDQALAASRTLRAASLSVDAAGAAADGARAQFRPTLGIDARYTRADGGRSFEIPVGDLLNPVYGALNGLVDGSPFPTIANQETPFLRPREQETRLRATQLIWSPAASADRTRRDREVDVASADLAVDRQRLLHDLTLAWYAWQEASRALEIQRAALDAVIENERSAERRLAEDLVTPDVAARARAERLAVDEVVAIAAAAEADARARVNFLREAELATSLPEAGTGPDVDALIESFDEAALRRALGLALPRRPELERVATSVAALDATADAVGATLRPTLALAVDFGIQGEEYGLGSEDRFVTGSLVVSWPILDGTVGAEARRIRLEARRLATQQEQIERGFALEIDAAMRAFTVAVEGVERADARATEAERVFRLVERRRDEGLATPLEFLDARSLRTAARLERASARTRVLMRLATLRWTAGLTPHLPEMPHTPTER